MGAHAIAARGLGIYLKYGGWMSAWGIREKWKWVREEKRKGEKEEIEARWGVVEEGRKKESEESKGERRMGCDDEGRGKR